MTLRVSARQPAQLSSSELTRSGTSLGSPAYMSPEQIRGRAVDGRSDLFSLAALLYESLCGVRPFAGEDLTALVYSVVHETPVPISKRAEGIPRGLDEFFDTALAKDPADRFQSGREFRQALERAGEGKPSDAFESTLVEPRAAEAVRPLVRTKSGVSTRFGPGTWPKVQSWSSCSFIREKNVLKCVGSSKK